MKTANLLRELALRNPKNMEDVHAMANRIGTMISWSRVTAAKSSTGRAHLRSVFAFRDGSELLVRVNSRGEAFEMEASNAVRKSC